MLVPPDLLTAINTAVRSAIENYGNVPVKIFDLDWTGVTKSFVIQYIDTDGHTRGRGKSRMVQVWYRHLDSAQKAYYLSEEKLEAFAKLNLQPGEFYAITSKSYNISGAKTQRWMWVDARKVTEKQARIINKGIADLGDPQ